MRSTESRRASLQLGAELAGIVAVLLSAACSKPQGSEPAPPTPVGAVTALAPVATIAAAVPSVAAKRQTLAASVASFSDDQLYACTDLSLANSAFLEKAVAASDAGAQQLADSELLTWLEGGKSVLGAVLNKAHGKDGATGLRPGGKPQILSKSCREQFLRKTIATCSTQLDDKADAGASMQGALRTTYYEATDDSTMAKCLAARGDWSELPHDSLEYQSSKAQRDLRRAQKALGQ